ADDFVEIDEAEAQALSAPASDQASDQSEGESIEPETTVEGGEVPASAATDDAADAKVEGGVEAATKE
ncbi:MAG: hypothetical protein O7H40_01470, partial [Gammaproteobacteria bacterium]|nr:hypothetical protein [Gammaproteobacteria bacterium]